MFLRSTPRSPLPPHSCTPYPTTRQRGGDSQGDHPLGPSETRAPAEHTAFTTPAALLYAVPSYAPARWGFPRGSSPWAVGDTSAPVTPFPAAEKNLGRTKKQIRTKLCGSQNTAGKICAPFTFSKKKWKQQICADRRIGTEDVSVPANAATSRRAVSPNRSTTGTHERKRDRAFLQPAPPELLPRFSVCS